MELEFDKYCIVDGSPTTVLPSSRRRSTVDKRTVDGKNELFRSNKDFTEISFHRFCSVSCKNAPSRAHTLEHEGFRKRGSVYQSSKEVRLMRKTDAAEERKKIELSSGSADALSFGMVDCLCESDEDELQVKQQRSSAMSLSSDFSAATSSKPDTELHSPVLIDYPFYAHPAPIRGVPLDECSEMSLDSDSRDNQSAEAAMQLPAQEQLFTNKPAFVPPKDGKALKERIHVVHLHKSLSAKLALPHSPLQLQSESDNCRSSSLKTRFAPVRKVFDPFVKSKSHRSHLRSLVEPSRENPTGQVSISQNKTLCKSLLRDFSNMVKRVECEPWYLKENFNQFVQRTPANLHGLLKLDKKQGLPLFEFCVKAPEDVFVARTWKAENGYSWIYTFHSVNDSRKSNASGWGFKEGHKASSMVGQMQVSCYLCIEPKGHDAFEKSIVTESVLYDISHPRRCVSSQDNPSSVSDVAKESDENSVLGSHVLDDVLVKTKVKGHPRPGSCHSDPSTSPPLDAAELHPHLQIGAIVVQVPYEKRESLKYKSCDQSFLNLLDSLVLEERKEHLYCPNAVKLNVVLPSGNHGLPTTEGHCPSPLLDRWRFGGGCDCGGWDIFCPLNILSNLSIRISEDDLLITNQQSLELFVQGKKGDTPALILELMEDGEYAVAFQPQLSVLQAFSTCVAVLHTTESSVRVRPEQNDQLLQSDSLRVFIEEEVKSLINAVAEEGKCKEKKRVEDALPSFIVNPPFSPIARV